MHEPGEPLIFFKEKEGDVVGDVHFYWFIYICILMKHIFFNGNKNFVIKGNENFITNDSFDNLALC